MPACVCVCVFIGCVWSGFCFVSGSTRSHSTNSWGLITHSYRVPRWVPGSEVSRGSLPLIFSPLSCYCCRPIERWRHNSRATLTRVHFITAGKWYQSSPNLSIRRKSGPSVWKIGPGLLVSWVKLLFYEWPLLLLGLVYGMVRKITEIKPPFTVNYTLMIHTVHTSVFIALSYEQLTIYEIMAERPGVKSRNISFRHFIWIIKKMVGVLFLSWKWKVFDLNNHCSIGHTTVQ